MRLDEAELITATRWDGASLAAPHYGVGPGLRRQEEARRRAELRLAAYLDELAR